MTINNSFSNALPETQEVSLSQPCGYRIDGQRVFINVSAISNNRDWNNLSGTLSLELWALKQPLRADYFEGVCLAGTSIGEISGQHFLAANEFELDFVEPPVGQWYLCLMLREWTASGYVTRDAVNFDLPYVASWKPSIIDNKNNVISVDFAQDSIEDAQVSTAVETEKDTSAQSKKGSSVNTAKATPPASDVAKAGSKVESGKQVKETKVVKDTENKKHSSVDQKELKATESPSVTDKPKQATLNLNEASLDEIAKLNGLSKKVAKNIYEARPFKDTKELLSVKGVGKKLLEKIQFQISV